MQAHLCRVWFKSGQGAAAEAAEKVAQEGGWVAKDYSKRRGQCFSKETAGARTKGVGGSMSEQEHVQNTNMSLTSIQHIFHDVPKMICFDCHKIGISLSDFCDPKSSHIYIYNIYIYIYIIYMVRKITE